MKLNELEAVIESILFISGDAVSINNIAKAINMDKATTKAIIKSLMDKYNYENRGLQIIELDNSYQMCTSPECFEYLRGIYKKPQKQILTEPILETLAIIAYKQPITKAEIEEIRGVNSEHAINKLIERNLICETGRLNTPGKPILFGTTKEFLRYFGFSSVNQLTPIDDIIIEKSEKNIDNL